MMRKWLCQADVTVQIEPVDPVMIKSGSATLDGPDMVPVSTVRLEEDPLTKKREPRQVYYFPGTSLKGVFRGHFERICRTLKDGSVCLPYYDPKKRKDIPLPVDSPAEREAAVGCGYREATGGREPTTATAYHEACAACRLFGSLRYGGRCSIGDAYPLPGKEPKTSHRNGVGIDRYTGGTVPGVLFDLLVLEGGTFQTQLRVVNFELWQLAALNFLLQDLRDEILSIGSGRSRGLGRVRGTVTHYTLTYVRPVQEVQGLAELSNEEERKQYGLFEAQPRPSIALPSAGTRRGLRHEHDLTIDWHSRLEPLAGSLDAFLQWHGGPKGRITGRE
jgi:CRISPR/Cas system CSM-associated protein Csm3 (group 7 of RAMP superfamily)